MPTPVRAVTSSIAPRIASPGGGLRSSVSASISTGPKMFKITSGIEGPRIPVASNFVKIDRSFAQFKPNTPRTTENSITQTFGPRIEFSKPQPKTTPKVGFTPELASKVDSNFAQARAKNQAQVEARKANQQISELVNQNMSSPNRNNHPDQPNRRSADLLNKSIDFRGLQTIPQVKEPAQEGPARYAIRGPEAQKFATIGEAPKPNPVDPIRRAVRPIVRVPLPELKPAIARYRAAARRRSETVQQVPPKVEAIIAQPISEPGTFSQILRDWKSLPADAISTNRLVKALGIPENSKQSTVDRLGLKRKTVRTEPSSVFPLKTDDRRPSGELVEPLMTTEPLPAITREKVASFTALRPLVEQGILTEDQAFQAADIISQPKPEVRAAKVEFATQSRPQIEGLSLKQQEQLASFAPLIKEGNPSVQEQIYQRLGINPEKAQKFIESLPKVGTRLNNAPETAPMPQEQPIIQQAAILIKNMDAFFGIEDEAELSKKAQALIATIKQTYQLGALGANETEMQSMVERTVATSDLIPQKSRSKLSLLLVMMVKSFQAERAAPPNQQKTDQRPQTKAVHQVHLEVQNKRAKLAVKSIDEAPTNEKGEISRDYVVGEFQTNNKKSFWSRLTILEGKSFDGSLDELIFRLKKLKFWEQRKVIAAAIDNSMAEFPAVEPSLRQTTKLVGSKEVGKVLDPALMEQLKAFVKAVLTVPQPAQAPLKAAA